MIRGGGIMSNSNNHGGARPGAGRKKKPLAEKILEGTTKKHVPRVLDISSEANVPDEVPDYLIELKAIDTEISVEEIYEETLSWLKGTGCLHLISPHLIMEFCVLKMRWLENEFIVGRNFMVKNNVGVYVPGEFYKASLEYLKAADAKWGQIWAIIAQNCETDFSHDPNADIMENLMRRRND